MKDKHGFTVQQNLGYSLATFFIIGLMFLSIMYLVMDLNFRTSVLSIILYNAFMTWFSIIRYVYLTKYE